MTWTLFSRSIYGRGGPRQGPPHPPTLGSAPGNPWHSSTLRSLADPLHVAVDRHLAYLHDLAVLDHDEPRPVGRPMVLVRIRERRGEPPGVELPQGLQRLLDRFARRHVAAALDRLDGHDHPQPPPHVGRGVRVVGVVLLVELHERLHA